eukprot:GHVU01086039.1.p1 GENE.GHVU01086039.1~~GHVU01086039.1.p1  ORF type:complete len:436 (+),score=47.89 GHVU01086039.1:157-1464(+)
MADEWKRQLRQSVRDAVQSDDDEDAAVFAAVYGVGSEEAEVLPVRQRIGGSTPGKAPNVDRNRLAGHQRLMADYFGVNGTPPTYNAVLFRRRFRMRPELFQRLVNACVEGDDYFRQKPDAIGVMGLSPEQKVVAAVRMMTYGVCADAVDEYVRIAETTANESFHRFVHAVVATFQEEYLRSPTPQDVQRHLSLNKERGFPGMFGSLDCTHWEWKNCPVALQGQYQDRGGTRSMIMEAVATEDLWIWHAFIGMPGSNNDLNVMHRSPLLHNMLQGSFPSVEYTVNGNRYSCAYLLVDGIYPPWTVFQKTIPEPQGEKRKFYAKRQEAVRKDVERCFGVVEARFHILSYPARTWDSEFMRLAWRACVIVHNMIIEDERDRTLEPLPCQGCVRPIQRVGRRLSLDTYASARASVTNGALHYQLQNDLVEHLWQVRGNS